MKFITYEEYSDKFCYPEILESSYEPCDDCILKFGSRACNELDCTGGLFIPDFGSNTYLPEDEDVSQKHSAMDTQVGGQHYKDMAIQPTEYIQKNKLNFCEGNIIKYASRHQKKGGLEDVKKIIHYAQLLARLEYGEDI